MSRLGKGILGPVQGTVGTVVGGVWNGIPYVRSKALRVKREPSLLQSAQRAKFGMTVSFVSSMTSLINVTWKDFAVFKSPSNSMVNHVLKEAIMGDYPSLGIDYSKVKVSRGNMRFALQPSATVIGGQEVQYSWLSSSSVTGIADDDKAAVIIYCPELKQCIFDFVGARRDLTVSIPVGPFKGKEVHTWLSFVSKDMKHTSESTYTGSFVLPV